MTCIYHKGTSNKPVKLKFKFITLIIFAVMYTYLHIINVDKYNASHTSRRR